MVNVTLDEASARLRAVWKVAGGAALLLGVALAAWHFTSRPPAGVREALETGRIPLPPFLADLNPAHESPAAGTNSVDAELISPKGTAVLRRRPEFQWDPVPGAVSYQVQVLAPGDALAAESGTLAMPSWSPAADLETGIIYQWQVIAASPSGKVKLPPAPEPLPRFLIVDAATAQRLASLSGSHVERAVEAARAGVMEDARREIVAAIAERPQDPALRKLLQFLSR